MDNPFYKPKRHALRFQLAYCLMPPVSSRLLPGPAALVAWALLQGTSPNAQELQAAPLVLQEVAPAQLKSSPMLDESIPGAVRNSLPTFVYGQRLFGRTNQETVIEGDAMLRRGDMVIQADRLEYDQSTDLAQATGSVRINRAGNVYEGPLLELKLNTYEGFFNQPRYYFLKNDSQGEADRVDFIDAQRTVIYNATLTTCRRQSGPDWMPDWILRANTISLDNEADVGTATGAVLTFKGVPVLPVPYLSFPLSDRRKSGFLPPTIGLNSVNGAELSVPYYWNIAPNLDATLTPTVMTKRGVSLGTELRYLEPDYAGQLRLDLRPGDQLRNSDRWGLSLAHQQRVDNNLTRSLTDNGVGLNLNLNRVSDDDYWRDFSSSATSMTQRLLINDASLAWNNGYFSSTVRALKWQTLQDVTAPIIPPYDRLPQLATRYARIDVSGFDYTIDADYTQFQGDSLRTRQPNAQRAFTQMQVSQPWISPQGFITPKLQVHASSYTFDGPLADGSPSASVVVPTFSLDSGMVFEREASYFGHSFRQTLEPRAFYVNTPYRDQNFLPNYDTGASDFNFATVYTENAFVGHDRISDSNLLTLGVTTRLLDPDTGAEAARFGVAQRLRFKDQKVVLPGGLPMDDRISDLLLGASVNWDKSWAFDSTVQFNPSTNESERSTIGAHYRAGDYRVVSAAYRYQRSLSEQVDVGWQWPINDLWGDKGQDLGPGRGQGGGRWYSVGRLNYSLNEGKLVDSIIGFEYDACCWLGRIVLERLQTSSSTASQRIMFQLEFVGFARLGVNPLQTLKNNITNYQQLRERTSSLSRFSNYD
jgi:LPS-assembly protein